MMFVTLGDTTSSKPEEVRVDALAVATPEVPEAAKKTSALVDTPSFVSSGAAITEGIAMVPESKTLAAPRRIAGLLGGPEDRAGKKSSIKMRDIPPIPAAPPELAEREKSAEDDGRLGKPAKRKKSGSKGKRDGWDDGFGMEKEESIVEEVGEPIGGGYDRQIAAKRLTAGTHDDNTDAAGWLNFVSLMRGQMAELGLSQAQIDAPGPGPRHSESPGALDIVLVMDTTGSMGDELEYLKVELEAIAHEVNTEFPQVEQRWGMVAYRDHGDEYVTRVADFSHINAFSHSLGAERAGGGGDTPEAMDLAMQATQQMSWRQGEDTARLVFLVADAPPHRGEGVSAYMGAVEGLRDAKTTLYPVAGSGVANDAEILMRTGAKMTGGQYIFLTDDSGVGGHHAAPHVKDYQVETLHDAMRRMIRLELGDQSTTADSGEAVGVCGYAQEREASMWTRIMNSLKAHFTFASGFVLWLLMAVFIDTRMRRRRQHIA